LSLDVESAPGTELAKPALRANGGYYQKKRTLPGSSPRPRHAAVVDARESGFGTPRKPQGYLLGGTSLTAAPSHRSRRAANVSAAFYLLPIKYGTIV
jgi:hypothetical protein